jgi:hypothetical protein
MSEDAATQDAQQDEAPVLAVGDLFTENELTCVLILVCHMPQEDGGAFLHAVIRDVVAKPKVALVAEKTGLPQDAGLIALQLEHHARTIIATHPELFT